MKPFSFQLEGHLEFAACFAEDGRVQLWIENDQRIVRETELNLACEHRTPPALPLLESARHWYRDTAGSHCVALGGLPAAALPLFCRRKHDAIIPAFEVLISGFYSNLSVLLSGTVPHNAVTPWGRLCLRGACEFLGHRRQRFVFDSKAIAALAAMAHTNLPVLVAQAAQNPAGQVELAGCLDSLQHSGSPPLIALVAQVRLQEIAQAVQAGSAPADSHADRRMRVGL